jgi:glucose-6-phosphate isomerase
VLARIDLRDTLFVAVSKSGGTIETVIGLGFFAEKLRQAGLELKQHMIAVTDPAKGPLRAFADQHDLDTCEIPPEVGGRFSVLTSAGLAPAALLHLDIAALLNGAMRMEALCRTAPAERDWPARLGLIAAEMCRRGKNQLVFMPYSSRLQLLSNWFVQLWDESLGKNVTADGKPAASGQTAIPAVGAADQHAQLQLFLEGPNDKLLLFTRIEKHVPDITLGEFDWATFGAGFVKGKTLGQVINAQQRGTAEACNQRQRPNATLVVPLLDASTLGELMLGLEIATTYAGYAFNVNPYDQPSVELGKQISRRMLGG